MLALFAALSFGAARPALQPVPDLDLDRYSGTWYEIARLDNRLESGCQAVTATHTVREDGRLAVTGRCRSRKLEVSSFRPPWADQPVIAIGDDYQWAVVGSPNRRQLWILARSPSLDRSPHAVAIAAAIEQGFDVLQLVTNPEPEVAED